MTKHHLGSSDKVCWTQCAYANFFEGLNKSTICSVKQVDSDTVEIIKRKDVKLGWLYWLGKDKQDVYERVTINRAEKTVSRDRIDANWWFDEPFLA